MFRRPLPFRVYGTKGRLAELALLSYWLLTQSFLEPARWPLLELFSWSACKGCILMLVTLVAF